jgi:hypothetical protein
MGNVDAFYPVGKLFELISFLYREQKFIHEVAFIE